MKADFCDIFFSKNNIDLYHYKHHHQIIDVSKHKNQILIPAIVIGIFSFFTFGLGGYLTARLLATHFKWKKIKEETDPTIAKISDQTKLINPKASNSPDQNLKTDLETKSGLANNNNAPQIETNIPNKLTPLEKTSGFPNAAGSTCYIATALQCLKNIPTFWKFLDETHKLQKTDEESEAQFALRNNIRTTMRALMEKSINGEEISKNEITDFRKLLNAYNPSVPLIGFGDRWAVCEVIFAAVELPLIKKQEKNKKTNIENSYFEKTITIGSNVPEATVTVQEAIDSKKTSEWSPKIVSLPPILAIDVAAIGSYLANADLGFKLEPSLQIEIKEGEEKLPAKYRLISFMQSPHNHYIAHVRNLNAEKTEWVCFNDMSVTISSQLKEEIKNQITCLFYERID